MTMYRADFKDKSKPVIKEPEPALPQPEDRIADLLSIVETVYEAGRKGQSLELLKQWAVEVWGERE